jgi:hypothetical protein
MPDWYQDVGMKIIITYFVQGIVPFVGIAKPAIISYLKI